MDALFHDILLLARPGLVMTPRPATAALVDRAVELAEGRRVRVADVGTGSGAIAVAFAHLSPKAEVWATDTCANAVELARANVERHGLADRVHVALGDLIHPVPGQLDLVLANLPYLPERLRPLREYREYRSEPPGAVFAPGDGLDPYRALVAAVESRLAVDGSLLIQLHRRVVEATHDGLSALASALAAEAAA